MMRPRSAPSACRTASSCRRSADRTLRSVAKLTQHTVRITSETSDKTLIVGPNPRNSRSRTLSTTAICVGRKRRVVDVSSHAAWEGCRPGLSEPNTSKVRSNSS